MCASLKKTTAYESGDKLDSPMKTNTKIKIGLIALGLSTFVGGGIVFSGRPTNNGARIPEADFMRWVDEVTPPACHVDKEQFRKEIEARIANTAQNYTESLKRERGQFESELDSILAGAKSAANGGIAPAIGYFTQFGNAAALVKDFVVDKEAANATISFVIGSKITNHLVYAQKQIEELLSNYSIKTREIANRYTAEIQGVIQEYDVPGIDRKLLEEIERTHLSGMESYEKALMSVGNAAAATAGELIWASTTKEAVKTILKLGFRTAIKRAGTTAAAAGTAAVADGPIPIGDIIGAVLAIGGGIWTAYDISDAYTEIRQKLPESLKSNIEKALRDAEASARSRADAWDKKLPQVVTI